MKLTEEQRNAFIEKNAGIIGDIAKKPLNNSGTNYLKLAKAYGYEYNDIFNTGVMGMIEGIEKYNIKKATTENGVVPLEAWVRTHIKKHLADAFGKPKNGDKLENKVSMDKKLFNSDGSSTTVGDMMAEEEHVENWGVAIDHEFIHELMSSDLLSDVELIAIDARFLKGQKHHEIDEILQSFLGNDKSKAFYFLNTAMDKIRKKMFATV